MNEFTYSYPVKIHFGEGAAAKHLPSELAKVGKEVAEFSGIMSNPTYAKVQEGVAFARKEKVDFILAVGGGSVVDCCKIISVQANLAEDIWEYECTGHMVHTEFIPMGAVVTVSGTGAEQNNGAVITNEEKRIKGAVLGAFAQFAVLDPAYTKQVPFCQVVSGAFDTLSHCMETYFGRLQDVTISDEINEAVMRNVIRNIRMLIQDHGDMRARSELMWASAMAENGILKIGKITDFQGHQIEHQLGAYTNCNHGMGLAVIHPALYRHIYKENLVRFVRFAIEVWKVDCSGKEPETVALEGIQALADFIKEIGLPTTFTEMGITDETILKAVADTCNISAGCCKKLDREEILEILRECL